MTRTSGSTSPSRRTLVSLSHYGPDVCFSLARRVFTTVVKGVGDHFSPSKVSAITSVYVNDVSWVCHCDMTACTASGVGLPHDCVPVIRVPPRVKYMYIIEFIAVSCDSHMFIILLQTIQRILSSIRAASGAMYSEELLIAGWPHKQQPY